MVWQPILDGTRADQARQAIAAIAAELVDALADRDGALTSGAAGPALFYAYQELAGLADGASERLEHCLRQVLAPPAAASPALFGGFTGQGWVLEHLSAWFPPAEGDPNESFDDALLAHLAGPSRAEYDLMSGLVGLGVHALERWPAPGARRVLEQVVARLEALAERRGDGVTWPLPPDGLTAGLCARFPDGAYDLGAAHGVAGVLALLGLAHATGLAPERTGPLLEGGVRWLLAQKLPPAAPLRYPRFVGRGGEAPTPSRLGWCHGDVGIAVALMRAARVTGRPDWEEEALQTARHAARCPDAPAGVVDAGLCHGAAGLGHLYNRLYQATGDDAFRETARARFAQTLTLREAGEGIGGFRSWYSVEEGRHEWRADPSFLTGAAGIGLSLLAAISDVEPAWDRLLMAAVPPA